LRIGFHISVAESTSILHINLVILLEMHDKEWDITSDRTISSSIRAVVGTIFTVFLMFELAVIWEYIVTTQYLVPAWEL
jgi:hypothetical protein